MNKTASSRFQALFLPPIVAQSVIVGGGYATGREIVEYVGRFGPKGWLAVLIIFLGFSVLSALAYEVARVGTAYNYKKWIRLLIGPLWPVFDLILVLMFILAIAVMSAAAGAILKETLMLQEWVGIGLVFVTVSFLQWKGDKFIEGFKTIGSVALYLAYIVFTILVLSVAQEPTVSETAPAAPNHEIVGSAIKYVGYNMAVFPAVLFCLYRQKSRTDTIAAGLLTGLAMTIPLAMTFVCILRFWPNTDVINAEIPWLLMLGTTANSTVWTVVFGIVVAWTLMETAVGCLHAMLDRIEQNIGDLPAFLRPRSGGFQPWQRAAISFGVLCLATLFAQIGIIDLVKKGYGTLAFGFIAYMVVPLLTVGIYMMVRGKKTRILRTLD